MRIHPFAALRPSPARAADVSSVPYDVVDRDEARALAEGNPSSWLRVIRSDLELPDDATPEQHYARAAENLARFRREDILLRDSAASLYLYRQSIGSHAQTGVVACCHVADYDADRIRKHELTRADKEDDRARHVRALMANTGPVFLAFRDTAALAALLAEETAGAPEVDFVAPDGVRHQSWCVASPSPWLAAFEDVPVLYIADGHHRAASAARVARDLARENPDHTGEEEYNWFMAVLFPADSLRILPYNRCVTDLNGHTPAAFRAALARALEPVAPAPATPARGEVRMYLEGKWEAWRFRGPLPDDPVAALDVSLLQERVLAPLLGIEDPRRSPRLDFVGGIRGDSELERRCREGRAAVAFALHPTTLADLMAVSDAGRIMPPKSTWFEPKLRSGLFVHTLDA